MSHARRHAVIDLGTNTFHLLIADIGGGVLREVYRERRYVKLASDGIETIGREPYLRGLQALEHYATILRQHECEQVTAIGTAALRTASNGPTFVRAAKEASGIAVQTISGDREAELITRGVLAAIPPPEDRILIMDIGGGSTEFIVADAERVYYRESFPIGVGVLRNEFHHAEPIQALELEALRGHLRQTLAPLSAALSIHPTRHLVGAAGTFDVLAELMRKPVASPHPTSHELDLSKFGPLRDRVLGMTLEQRLSIPGIPSERADMIVVAFVLLDFTLELANVNRVTVSSYAMKEGILLDGMLA